MTYKIYSEKYGEYRKGEYSSKEEAQKEINNNEGDCEEVIIEVCACGEVEPYGFVPESGCKKHDNLDTKK